MQNLSNIGEGRAFAPVPQSHIPGILAVTAMKYRQAKGGIMTSKERKWYQQCKCHMKPSET